MTLEKSAEKLRHAAERPTKPASQNRNETEAKKTDMDSADIHGELTHPDHNKGQPPANPGKAK